MRGNGKEAEFDGHSVSMPLRWLMGFKPMRKGEGKSINDVVYGLVNSMKCHTWSSTLLRLHSPSAGVYHRNVFPSENGPGLTIRTPL